MHMVSIIAENRVLLIQYRIFFRIWFAIYTFMFTIIIVLNNLRNYLDIVSLVLVIVQNNSN